MSDDQIKSLFNIVGLTDSEEMLNELRERKTGPSWKPEPKQPETTQPAPVKDYSQDVEALRSKIDGFQQRESELKSELARQQGTLQAYIAQQNRGGQQAQQEAHLQSIKVDDPDLQAALNAIDERNAKRFEAYKGQTEQQRFQNARESEYARMQTALREVRATAADWHAAVPDQIINEFAMSYINNPASHGKVDWKAEFNLAVNNYRFPSVQARLEAAEKELAQYKKGAEKSKEQQKANLTKVSGNSGASGGNAPSGRSHGEDILSDWYKKNGRKSRMPAADFSKALFARVTAQN